MPVKIALFKNRQKQRGSGIIGGVIAATVFGIVIVTFGKGYLSSIQFKSLMEQKHSFNDVETGFLGALAQSSFYGPTSGSPSAGVIAIEPFITRLLGGTGLDVLGMGKLVPFDKDSASKLKGTTAAAAVAQCEDSAKIPKIPSSTTADATFLYCLSFNSTTSAKGDTFFGSDAAFAMVKVNLKPTIATQRNFMTAMPSWGSFISDPNPIENFQAQIIYSVYWGKTHQESKSFEKMGMALKDLR